MSNINLEPLRIARAIVKEMGVPEEFLDDSDWGVLVVNINIMEHNKCDFNEKEITAYANGEAPKIHPSLSPKHYAYLNSRLQTLWDRYKNQL